MELIDISMEIHEQMQVYKNKPEKKPKLEKISFPSGASETQLSFNSHTGTHIDFPRHQNPDGKTLEEFSLQNFFGKACVLDFSNLEEKISEKDLKEKENLIEEGTAILLKTKNSFSDEFDFNFVFLDKKGAEFLKEKKVKIVGIDGLGIERNQEGHPTHKILLNNDIPILEGLRLGKIEEGFFDLIAFPLKIREGDASPVRAVLAKK